MKCHLRMSNNRSHSHRIQLLEVMAMKLFVSQLQRGHWFCWYHPGYPDWFQSSRLEIVAWKLRQDGREEHQLDPCHWLSLLYEVQLNCTKLQHHFFKLKHYTLQNHIENRMALHFSLYKRIGLARAGALGRHIHHRIPFRFDPIEFTRQLL